MKGIIENWDDFIDKSCDLTNINGNTRMVLKYRNKPARGKLTITDSNKSMRYLFSETNSIEKLDTFTKKYFHLLANKPFKEEEIKVQQDNDKDKKQVKKGGNKGKKK